MSTALNFRDATIYDPRQATPIQDDDGSPRIHLNPPLLEESRVRLSPNVSTPLPYDNSVLDQRSLKYDYALGEDSPGQSIMRQELMIAGGEERQRTRAARKRELETAQLKTQLLREYVSSLDRSPTQDDVDLIMGLGEKDLENPATFFEREFAKKMIRDAATLDMGDEQVEIAGVIVDDSVYGEAYAQDPEGTMKVLDAAEYLKTNQELDLRRLEDAEARRKRMGWGKTLSDIGELFLPGLSWYRRSNLTDQGEGGGSFWLGKNMQDTVKALNFMPIEERKAEADRIFNELWDKNYLDAIAFAQALVEYNGTDAAWDNSITVIDPTILVSPATSVARLASKMKNLTKATAGRITNPVLAIEATGDIEKSAGAAAAFLVEKAKATRSPKSMGELLYQVPAISNSAKFLGEDLGHFSRELANRIVDTMSNITGEVIHAAFKDVVSTSRLGPQAQEAARDSMRDIMNKVYGQGSDVVIDVDLLDPLTTVGEVSAAVIKLGRKDATLFDTAEQAMNMAKDWYGLTNYKVKTQGGKYYIEVLKPIDETAPRIRDAYKLETANDPAPRTLPNLFLFWARSKDYLLPRHAQESLMRGTIGGQALMRIGQKLWKEIGSLRGKEAQELTDFLNHQRDYYDVLTKDRGKFSNSLAEFEADWVRKFSKLPTDKQAQAYFAARTFNDLDYILRNLAIYRDKSRKGMELFDFIPGAGTRPTIEGIMKPVEDFWKFKEDAGLVVIDDNGLRYARKNWMPAADDPDPNVLTRRRVQELMDTGRYRLVKITDVGRDALIKRFEADESVSGWGRVDFVLSPYTRSAPLEFKQIPYNPGGHVALEDGWMIRQPIIKRGSYAGAKTTDYLGDRNYLHFVVEKDGKEILKRLEHLRDLYKKASKRGKGDAVARLELIKLIKSGYLPHHNLREFARLFGGKNPKYDINEPFVLTRTNQSVEDVINFGIDTTNYPNFTSKKNSVYNDYEGGIGLEYAGERGGHTYTIASDGSFSNPTYNFTRAKYIDADVTLERAFNSMLKDRYFGDIKHSLSEKFVAEFGNLLANSDTADGWARIVNNPLKAMLDGNFKPNVDPISKRAALNWRRASMELLGRRSGWDLMVDTLQNKLTQKIYNRLGYTNTEKLLDVMDFADSWSYGLIKDPARFFKRIATSSKLGLLNPAQLFVQGSAFVNAVAILGPRLGQSAMRAATIGKYLDINPDHLKYGAKIAGWKPEHLQEASDMAKRLQWFRVGNEYAAVDDIADPGLRQTRLGMINDWGHVFWKAGESIPRRVAWYGAYAEWRSANPTAKFTEEVGSRILKRADDLSMNMTAASNAQYQKGWTGLPTQFWSYHARLLEQLWGNKLTGPEKARLFAVNAVLHGLPVAAGIGVGVWEPASTWREYADKWGISDDIQANAFLKFLQDGMVNIFTELFNDGQQIDISGRIGPGGLPFIEDLIKGDTSIVEGLTGVGIKTALEIFDPFATLISGAITGRDDMFETTWEDIWDIVRTTSHGNNAYNLYHGLAYGEFISRARGLPMDTDVSVPEAIFKYLMGADPVRIGDLFRRQENMDEIAEYKKDRIAKAVREFKRALRLDPNKDEVEQMKHIKRGWLILNTTHQITPEDRQQALRDAAKGDEGLFRSNAMRWMKVGPEQMKKAIQEMEALNKRSFGE